MSSNSSSSSSSSSTSTAASATHTIQVGPRESPHQYVPHSISANVGDVVVFQFYPRNHSVVQADYNAPCIPANGDYFFSGIFDTFDEVNGQLVGDPPTWSWTVDRSEPTFFYCTAIDSCLENGMVGAINPNASMTWQTQYTSALNAPYMLFPGQPMPAEGEQQQSSPSSTTSSASPSSPSTTLGNPSASSSSSSSLSGGAIAGIVIGAVIAVLVIGALLFLLGRNNVYKQWVTSQSAEGSTTARTARWALFQSGGPGPGPGTGAMKSEMDSCVGGGSLPYSGASPVNMALQSQGQGQSHGHSHSQSQSQSLRQSQGPGPGPGSGPELGIGQVEYGYGHPGQQQQQQQQPPYWIWDQSVMPKGRVSGPSELEGTYMK